MESCKICGHAPSVTDKTVVPCNGPCGRIVHASCATASDGVMLASAVERYWFCNRCRRGLRPAGARTPEVVPEIAELPTEIWIEIFKLVSRWQLLKLRLVCRRWRDIVDGSSALSLKNPVWFSGFPTNPHHLPPATNVCIVQAEITAGASSWWPPFGHGLLELEISYTFIDDLLALLKHTPNLRSFKMEGVQSTKSALKTPPDFRLENLEKLILLESRTGQIRDLLEDFRIMCNNLKTLQISWEAYRAVNFVQVTTILYENQDTLQELDTNCSNDTLVEMMKFDRLKLKKLTFAVLGPDISSSILIELCRLQQSLEHLDIQRITTFDASNSTEFTELCRHLPNLKFLSISLGSENGSIDLATLSFLTKLKTLVLAGSYETIYKFKFAACGYPNIDELRLENVCLSDKQLKRLLKKMPNIRVLSISTCHYWEYLLKNLGSLDFLQKLTLEGVDTCETDYCYLDDLVNLQYLCIYGCETSTDLLATILSRCPYLEELKLFITEEDDEEYGYPLDEEILRLICRKLTRLSELAVFRQSLSEEAERYIRANCRSLENLRYYPSI